MQRLESFLTARRTHALRPSPVTLVPRRPQHRRPVSTQCRHSPPPARCDEIAMVATEAQPAPSGGEGQSDVSCSETGMGIRARCCPSILQSQRRKEAGIQRERWGSGRSLPLTNVMRPARGGMGRRAPGAVPPTTRASDPGSAPPLPRRPCLGCRTPRLAAPGPCAPAQTPRVAIGCCR